MEAINQHLKYGIRQSDMTAKKKEGEGTSPLKNSKQHNEPSKQQKT